MAGENHVCYFGLWDRDRDRAAHKHLGGQKLVVNDAQTFINKIADILDRYIILISKEGVKWLFK